MMVVAPLCVFIFQWGKYLNSWESVFACKHVIFQSKHGSKLLLEAPSKHLLARHVLSDFDFKNENSPKTDCREYKPFYLNVLYQILPNP